MNGGREDEGSVANLCYLFVMFSMFHAGLAKKDRDCSKNKTGDTPILSPT